MDPAKQYEQNVAALTQHILENIVWEQTVHTAHLPYEYGPGVIEYLIEAVLDKEVELVIVVTSGWSWVKSSPTVRESEKHSVLHLTGRPKDMCPKELREKWAEYEKSNLKNLGRKELCPDCRNKHSCPWVRQWREEIQSARIVVFDHSMFENFPGILELIKKTSRKDRALILFEDANLARFSYRHTMLRQQIVDFYALIKENLDEEWAGDDLRDYHDLLAQILRLDSQEIATTTLRKVELELETLSKLQAKNLQQLKSKRISFPIYAIQNFCEAEPAWRYLDEEEDFSYYYPPQIPDTTVVLGRQNATSFFRRKVTADVVDISMPDNIWQPQLSSYINYPTLNGTRKWLKYERNIGSLCHNYAQLIMKQRQQNKKVLVVAIGQDPYQKVDFIKLFRDKINALIRAYSNDSYFVSPYNSASPETPPGESQIPIISYGDAAKLGATGMYQDYDVLICVTGFYLNNGTVNDLFWEKLLPDQRGTLSIDITRDHPRRRTATCPNLPELNQDAQAFLDLLELGQVHKTISCINPQIAPREIYLMQCGQLSGVSYAQEYSSPSDMHQDQKLLSLPQLKQEKQKQDLVLLVMKCRLDGLTQRQTADKLNVKLHTIQRLWKQSDPAARQLDVLN